MEKIEILLTTLEPEIEKKCMEIQRKKRERTFTRLFVTLMMMLLIIPPVLVFAGVNLLTIFLPVIFIAIGFLVLSPILMSKEVILGE